MIRPRRLGAAAVFAAGLTITVSATRAAPIVYTGSQGSLAASVSFEVSGTALSVILTNTKQTACEWAMNEVAARG